MPPNSIGSKFDVLRRIGPFGIFKTCYHSRRIGENPLSLILHANTHVDISSSAEFNIDGTFFVGSIAPRSSRAISSTKLSVAPDATVYASEGLPRIGHGSTLRIEGDFSIGNTFINSELRLICEEKITIGKGCAIAWDVTITDTDRHKITVNDKTKRATAPVAIKDDVWIGYGTSVKKGVTISEGAVVASNSVVTDDVPPQTLVAGSPARMVKENVTWGEDTSRRYR